MKTLRSIVSVTLRETIFEKSDQMQSGGLETEDDNEESMSIKKITKELQR